MLSVDIGIRFPGFSLEAAFNTESGITAISGPSGAGKTTLINAIAGMIRPERGQITIGERCLFSTQRNIHLAPEKRRIGYIYQDARLFPHLTVQQNLIIGRFFQGHPTNRALFDQIVDMLGIAPILTRRPHRLSGGEKQRVAIGRALLSEPALILADEPLAALDADRKAEILPYFESLRDLKQLPILYVTHQGEEIERLADQHIRLDAGRLQVLKSST